MKLTKNADHNKYGYSRYGTGFHARSQFSLPDGSWGKNVIIFGVNNSYFVNADNKEKDILVLDVGPTQRSDDIAITAEDTYPTNFTESGKRFVLSLHYNGSNSSLFVNATKIN